MKKLAAGALILLLVGMAFLFVVRRPVIGNLSFVAATNWNGTNIFIFQPEESKRVLGNVVGWGSSWVTIISYRDGKYSDSVLGARIPQQLLGYLTGVVAVEIPKDVEKFRVRFDRKVRDGWTLNR